MQRGRAKGAGVRRRAMASARWRASARVLALRVRVRVRVQWPVSVQAARKVTGRQVRPLGVRSWRGARVRPSVRRASGQRQVGEARPGVTARS